MTKMQVIQIRIRGNVFETAHEVQQICTICEVLVLDVASDGREKSKNLIIHLCCCLLHSLQQSVLPVRSTKWQLYPLGILPSSFDKGP